MTEVPIFIPTFNNPSHLANILSQLNAIGYPSNKITVLDNDSTYHGMLNLLSELESKKYNIVRLHNNLGPRYFLDGSLYKIIESDYFILTDPDISININMPNEWVDILIELTEHHKIGKIGLALSVFNELDELKDPEKVLKDEQQYWVDEVSEVEYTEDSGEMKTAKVYKGNVDTTFALYNKKYFNYYYGKSMALFYNALRIAGDFECKHIPWYKNDMFTDEEREYYIKSSVYSSGFSNNNVNPYATGRIK
jgi:hypothetical protein